jgi:hypothetical protein
MTEEIAKAEIEKLYRKAAHELAFRAKVDRELDWEARANRIRLYGQMKMNTAGFKP